jgi:hypothetical protein
VYRINNIIENALEEKKVCSAIFVDVGEPLIRHGTRDQTTS